MTGGVPPPAVYTGIDEVDRADWDRVTEAARAPVFYDYRFLLAYERAPLQETKAFFYLTFGQPASAVLPAYVQSADDPLGNIAALGLPDLLPGDAIVLTHIAHCYDTVIPAGPGLLTPGLVESACAALADLTRQAGAKYFTFLNVDGSGATASCLTTAGLTKIPMNTRFRADVSDYASAEEFTADIPSAKARRTLRYSLHQARRAGMVTGHRSPGPDAAESVEMCRRTTARHGTAEYYPERFHEFVALAAELISVTEVRLRDRLASAAICLTDPARFHLWAGGIDYEITAALESAFPLMLWPAIEETCDRGLAVLEAGRGNAPAKLRFRLEPVPLFAFVGRA